SPCSAFSTSSLVGSLLGRFSGYSGRLVISASSICLRTSRSKSACTSSSRWYSHSKLSTRLAFFSHTGLTANTLLSCSCRFSAYGWYLYFSRASFRLRLLSLLISANRPSHRAARRNASSLFSTLILYPPFGLEKRGFHNRRRGITKDAWTAHPRQ